MAFFRKIFDEVAPVYPEISHDHAYVDAQALNLIRHPWAYDVLVMENMFGDILSDLAGGLVGGMGMAACAEIGDLYWHQTIMLAKIILILFGDRMTPTQSI